MSPSASAVFISLFRKTSVFSLKVFTPVTYSATPSFKVFAPVFRSVTPVDNSVIPSAPCDDNWSAPWFIWSIALSNDFPPFFNVSTPSDTCEIPLFKLLLPV